MKKETCMQTKKITSTKNGVNVKKFFCICNIIQLKNQFRRFESYDSDRFKNLDAIKNE